MDQTEIQETPDTTEGAPRRPDSPVTKRLDRSLDDLVADLALRERQIEAIRKTSDALFSHPSVDAMIEATLRIALDVLRADAGSVILYESESDALVFRYVVGGAGESLIGKKIPARQGVAGTVFQSGESVLVSDVTQRADHIKAVGTETGYQTNSMMTVPVKRTGGTPIGVMQILNASVSFTRNDLEVLEVLCSQAATGIEHAQLLEAQRNAEIGNRVGEIAHDIKNMMTPIESGVGTLEPILTDMFADLMKIMQTCPEAEEWGKSVSDAIGLAHEMHGWLLEDLMTSAKRVRRRTEYIAGMVKGVLPPLVLEEGSVNDVARDVVKTLARGARDRGVTLKTDLDANLPRTAFDYDRLYDCLYNLVNNALPETPSGGSVTVRTNAPTDIEPGILTVQVRDTGRGIPEAIRVKLFTRDVQSTKPGGTGLGTSVAARVAYEHGGSISVESEIGVGSTFTIRLAVNPPAQEPTAE